jgi:predicted metal-dependent phosphoesterase TrpH
VSPAKTWEIREAGTTAVGEKPITRRRGVREVPNHTRRGIQKFQNQGKENDQGIKNFQKGSVLLSDDQKSKDEEQGKSDDKSKENFQDQGFSNQYPVL